MCEDDKRKGRNERAVVPPVVQLSLVVQFDGSDKGF